MIHDDNQATIREIQKLESNIPQLQKLIKIFEGLDIGKLDEKTALSLLMNKGERAGEMFLKVIAADCLATGNRNKHFINQQIQAQESTVNSFKSEVRSLLEEIGTYFNFSDYSFEVNKGYFISETQKELISERNKKYLTDPNEIEVYNEFKKTFQALESLGLKLNKYNGLDTSYSLCHYFESENHFRQKIVFFNESKILELFRKKTLI